MKYLVYLAAYFLLFCVGLSNGGKYPVCWIKNGECLDGNVGPLIEAIKPQINHNIANESVMNVMSLDDFAKECLKETECRYVR